jgi:hypothetical protein
MKLSDMPKLLGLMLRRWEEIFFCYWQSLPKNDAFLGKIENHGFALLSLAKKMVEKKD